nr:MAG TPA: hypothetical protein [Caudoviricetes sp.]
MTSIVVYSLSQGFHHLLIIEFSKVSSSSIFYKKEINLTIYTLMTF